MKKIEDLAPVKPSSTVTGSTKSPDETLKKTESPPIRQAWIAQLFKKWQARYGHKWVSAIDGIEELAVNEWAECLSGLTGDDIKQGLSLWDESWPPSAPEFRKCCLKQSEAWQHKGPAYRDHPHLKALPHKCDPEKAESALEEMKRKLGM